MNSLEIGEYFGRREKKKILDKIELPNGWILIKTENKKSEKDFKVRTITNVEKMKYYTPKHAHFAIDFYGKYCQNKEKAKYLFNAIIEVWQGGNPDEIIEKYKDKVKGLIGYEIEYILYALNWILEQENVNFKGRDVKLQEELDKKFKNMNIEVPEKNKGSQLAISLFIDILNGIHPVEAFLSARLDVIPRKRAER